MLLDSKLALPNRLKHGQSEACGITWAFPVDIIDCKGCNWHHNQPNSRQMHWIPYELATIFGSKSTFLKRSELKYKIVPQERLSKQELFSKSCQHDRDKGADVLESSKLMIRRHFSYGIVPRRPVVHIW